MCKLCELQLLLAMSLHHWQLWQHRPVAAYCLWTIAWASPEKGRLSLGCRGLVAGLFSEGMFKIHYLYMERRRNFVMHYAMRKNLRRNGTVSKNLNLTQGDTKRCRLSWLTNSTIVYEPKCGGGGVLRGFSQ